MPRTPASRLADALRDADLGLRRRVVDLAPASDAWARAFAGIHEVLAETAPPSVVAIEHIGSTSVPGLDAKPILDVGIAVRSGHHCAHPLMRFYGVPATVRASLAFYNTHAEIDLFVSALARVRKLLA